MPTSLATPRGNNGVDHERRAWPSNPLYEFSKSGVALWGQHQRAVDAAWREALTNPDMARTMSSALGLKQPTPMQLSKTHAYLLTAGLLYPSDSPESP